MGRRGMGRFVASLKNLRTPLIIMGTLILSSGLTSCGFYASQAEVAVQPSEEGNYNLESLDMYGVWEQVESYGEVWHPDVGPGWRPFYYGRWTYTDEGWDWVSYENFGWIVYHYGDWVFSPDYGWLWIPGNVWSPARVHWLEFDDNICWAPMTPPGVEVGEPWEAGPGINFWLVVNIQNFTRENVGRYHVSRRFEEREHERFRIFRRAPEIGRVERFEGRRIEPVPLHRRIYRTPLGELRRNEYPPEEHRRILRHQRKLDHEVLHPNRQRMEERRRQREIQEGQRRQESEEHRGRERREPKRENKHDRD